MPRKKLSSRAPTKTKKDFVNGLYLGLVTPLAEDGEITIAYAFQRFRLEQEAKGNSKATIAYYERFMVKYNNYLMDSEGISINEAAVRVFSQPDDRNHFINYLGAVKPQTVNSYLRAYRAFGNYCYEQGIINNFECPIKTVETPIKDVYTKKELEKLLVKPPIDNFEQFRNYTIISLLLGSGARSNTILNIQIKDVDLEEGYIAFNTTKANKVVRVGLERKVKSDLREYINRWRLIDGAGEEIPDTHYLFCNTYGDKLTRSGLCKAIASYNKARGVEKTSIHLFRHTYAKNWITSGGDIISLARVLTHSDLEMVKKYANLYGEDVKAEIEQHSIMSQMRTKSGKTLKTKLTP